MAGSSPAKAAVPPETRHGVLYATLLQPKSMSIDVNGGNTAAL